MPVNTRIFSWLLGTALVYAGLALKQSELDQGISKLIFQRPESAVLPACLSSQCPFCIFLSSQVVKVLRFMLGDRLGEFYDEEGEALHLCVCI